MFTVCGRVDSKGLTQTAFADRNDFIEPGDSGKQRAVTIILASLHYSLVEVGEHHCELEACASSLMSPGVNDLLDLCCESFVVRNCR
jgi:hypothetical protein